MSNMDDFTQKPELLLATVHNLFKMEKRMDEVEVISSGKCSLEQTDYDNWDGGIYIYTLYVQLPPFYFYKIQRQD